MSSPTVVESNHICGKSTDQTQLYSTKQINLDDLNVLRRHTQMRWSMSRESNVPIQEHTYLQSINPKNKSVVNIRVEEATHSLPIHETWWELILYTFVVWRIVCWTQDTLWKPHELGLWRTPDLRNWASLPVGAADHRFVQLNWHGFPWLIGHLDRDFRSGEILKVVKIWFSLIMLRMNMQDNVQSAQWRECRVFIQTMSETPANLPINLRHSSWMTLYLLQR